MITIFAKCSNLAVWQGSEYASGGNNFWYTLRTLLLTLNKFHTFLEYPFFDVSEHIFAYHAFETATWFLKSNLSVSLYKI